MDKITQAIIESGLPVIHEEMVKLQNSLESFPAEIGNTIDGKVQESVNKIVVAAEAVQTHADELVEGCKSEIQTNLNIAQANFLIAAKDGLDAIINPKIKELNSLIAKSQNKLPPKALVFAGVIGMAMGVALGLMNGQLIYKPKLDESNKVNTVLFHAQKLTNAETMTKKQIVDWQIKFTTNFRDLIDK